MSRKDTEFSARDQLDRWAAEAPSESVRAMVLLAATPLILLVAIEWAPSGESVPFPLPWAESSSPFEPGLDDTFECGRDLVRRAALPVFRTGFSEGSPLSCALTTDDRGYLGRRSHVPGQRTTWIVGASFATAGSHYAATLGPRLEHHGAPNVFNRAWPGRGPAFALRRLLQDGDVSPGDTVVWTIVQRALRAAPFRPLRRAVRVGADSIELESGPDWRSLARKVRDWPRSIEGTLEFRSVPRTWSRNRNAWALPARLDLGATSAVRPARLVDGTRVLFFSEEVDSYSRTWAAAGGDRLADIIAVASRLLESRGAKLLVVLIPDRFEVYQPHLDAESSVAFDVVDPGERVPERMERELRARGVTALDLYPLLAPAAMETPSAFRSDDTHWSNAGIDLAARAIADVLAGEPFAGR
ncbi:MAG: hypothetical protein AAF430_21775 [Myxococcota bacterium]